MYYSINSKYLFLKEYLLSVPERFEQDGETIYDVRNVLKTFTVGEHKFCVKSFQPPHVLNKFVYAYFRQPKAERSFLYATRFMELGIGTPEPAAFIVYRDWLGVTRSYYIYQWQDCDFTFRGIATLPIAEQEDAYKAFTRFTYDFHKKGVYFVDYSAGNTLVKQEEDGAWSFWLVDLNRTNFVSVSPEMGIKNLCMLELPEGSLKIIATEYARLTKQEPNRMIRTLIRLTYKHNCRVWRKSKIRNARRKIKRFLFR